MLVYQRVITYWVDSVTACTPTNSERGPQAAEAIGELGAIIRNLALEDT